MPILEEKPHVIIAHNTRAPQDEDTQRMAFLIGKPLTRIEIHQGTVVIEFDPYGKITIQPHFAMDIDTSINEVLLRAATPGPRKTKETKE